MDSYTDQLRIGLMVSLDLTSFLCQLGLDQFRRVLTGCDLVD